MARTTGSGSAAAPISIFTSPAHGLRRSSSTWRGSRRRRVRDRTRSGSAAGAGHRRRRRAASATCSRPRWRGAARPARDRLPAAPELRQHAAVARAGAVHHVGGRHRFLAAGAVAPPRIHLPCRPFRRLVVMARRARVRHAVARGHLRSRRAERVIAPPHEHPPVDVAHVAVDAAAPLALRRVKRVRAQSFGRGEGRLRVRHRVLWSRRGASSRPLSPRG